MLVAHQRVVDSPVPVVVTPQGRAVVTWSEDARRYTLPTKVQASVREPGAAGWSAPVSLSGSESAFNTAVAGHGANGVTVAWQAFGKGDAVGIWARTLGPSGHWRPAIRVANYEVRSGATVDLNIDVANDAMVVTWRSRGGLFARVRSTAGVWGPVHNLPTSANAATVAASLDTAGRADVFAIQQRGSRDLLVDWRQLTGGGWRRTVVGAMGGDQLTPSVASNGSGDVVATWTRRGASGELQAMMRTRPAGGAWGRGVITGTHSAAVDVDLTGHDVTLVRQRYAHGHIGVLERRGFDGELVWRHRLGRTSRYDAVTSTLDANRAGQVVAFYYTSRLDGTGDYVRHGWALRCTDKGACGNPSKDVIPPQQYPQAAVGPDGSATFVWSAGCRTEECQPTRVVSRRLLPAP